MATLALVVLACSDPLPTTDVTVTTVELSAPTATVRAGGTLTLGVRVLDTGGNPVDNIAVYWSSSDIAIASVSATGVVTASAAGKVIIAASALGKSGTKTLTVTDREVATVQIAPASVSVRIGTSVPLAAQVLDAEGSTLTGRAVTWTSSNAAVATVSASGSVTAVAAGATTVTATSEGRSATAAITVTVNPVATVTVSPSTDTLGVGTEATLSAALRDAGGALLTSRNVAWNSSNVQVATVSSTGVVTALAPGNVAISAVSEGRVGSASVLVLARLASTVTLTPASTAIIVGTTVQLSPQVTDPAGNILTGRPISYVSDNSAVATVNSTGLVTAITPGSARITATSEGKVGTATITVNPLPVASVQVTPATGTVLVGGTRQLAAQALSDSGQALAGRTVTWTSGAPGVASVSPAGLVTGIAPGIAVIVAVADGVPGFATITVERAVVASVGVTATLASIAVSGTSQLTATARDGTGGALTDRVTSWSSSDENIAFVTSTGTVLGLRAGTVTITATVEGVRGTVVITVR